MVERGDSFSWIPLFLDWSQYSVVLVSLFCLTQDGRIILLFDVHTLQQRTPIFYYTISHTPLPCISQFVSDGLCLLTALQPRRGFLGAARDTRDL